MIVLDASVAVDALADAGPAGDAARAVLARHATTMAVPDVFHAEVVGVLRRLAHPTRAALTAERADRAVAALRALPVQVVATAGRLDRVWELRHAVTAMDACYVAVAESLECPLVTSDARLAGTSASLRCPVRTP